MSDRLFGGLNLSWRNGGKRTPVILQTEGAECGLACMAMILSHHGLHTDLPGLRKRFSLSMKGATMIALVRLAEQLNLSPRALRAEPEHLTQLQLPCVLHWDMNHFVVLTSLRGQLAVIHDPAHGRREFKLSELSRHFTGVVLELTPTEGFAPGNQRQQFSLRQLLGKVTGLKRSVLQIIALALALEVFTLLAPFFLQWVVDGVLVSADRDLLVTLGLGFGLLVLLQVATGALRSWAVLVLSATLNLQWLSNVFAHLLRLPLDWFEKRHAGDIWSRFTTVQQIQKTLTTSFVEAVLDGLMVVVTLAMMAVYSGMLTAVALSAVAAYALLRWAFFAPLRAATEEALVFEAKRSSHFLESLRGVQAIKLFNAEADRRSRFMNLVVDSMNADIATRKLDLLASVLNKLLFGVERIAIIWLGALLVMDARFSVGMLFAFLAYKELFALRISGLIDKVVELSMLRLQGERLADIVLTAPESHAEGSASQQVLSPRLELDDLSFRYSDAEPEVISHCKLVIEPGESVAIVGPSGCGKTTLLKLMIGMQQAQSGEVRVGGVPLAQLGQRRWRAMFGAVMQDDQLFAGSIADNISFFDPEADSAWIAECARMACVHDEIEAMPMAYLSLIGDMGSSISGGQKQRLLLARALYKRPQILFLDEATSALDVDKERQVNQAIRQLELTRVIVAHRPETIAAAQRVIVLQGGRVAQDLRSVSGGPGSSDANRS